MKKLSLTDHILLTLDNPKQPMNVAGICLFEMPANADDGFIARLIDDVKMTTALPTFPFNQVIDRRFFWKTDTDFDINYHFRHIKLPPNSAMTALLAYISAEHSRPMDRTRPLWEFHLIEGVADGRFAVYFKLHHAMADGIAGMRMLQMSLSPNPNETLTSPLWVVAPKERKHSQKTHPTLSKLAKEQLGNVVPVVRELARRWQDRALPAFTSGFDAPPCLLNQKISASRYVGVLSFDKDRFARVASHFGTTTNDVVLAVCAGALRAYLSQNNALPAKPLIAFVPVSLRQDKSAIGNQISFLLANLGTHLSNPADRLATIAQSVADGKARFAKLTQSQIINYSLAIYGLAGLNLATGLLPTRQAFNVIISNIPGKKEPLYLNGAKLTGIYPASVLLDGQALNITLANYENTLDFCITACDTALPDVGGLLGLLDAELGVLESLI